MQGSSKRVAMEEIRKNLDEVRARMEAAARRAGRVPDRVRLIAVSKTVSPALIRQAIACGQLEFGENRVQEALDKMRVLGGSPARWHFVGHLQTNKVRRIMGAFDLIHSVDSLKLATAIGDRMMREDPAAVLPQPILIQVNVSGEAAKSGVAPDRLMDLLKGIARTKGLQVRGLMTIPPWTDRPDSSRPYFKALRELARFVERQGIEGIGMQELSMGMSGDFEAAIEEGATLVRIGSAIFGRRDYN